MIRQAAAAAPEDEKIRKFATSIVEFSQVTEPVTQYCNVTLTVRWDTNVSNVYQKSRNAFFRRQWADHPVTPVNHKGNSNDVLLSGLGNFVNILQAFV